MEITGVYAWSGNNRTDDDHRTLTISTDPKTKTLVFKLEVTAGVSNGHTLRGRVEPVGPCHFRLIAEVDESRVRGDKPRSKSVLSQQRLDFILRAPTYLVDGEAYKFESAEPPKQRDPEPDFIPSDCGGPDVDD